MYEISLPINHMNLLKEVKRKKKVEFRNFSGSI